MKRSNVVYCYGIVCSKVNIHSTVTKQHKLRKTKT